MAALQGSKSIKICQCSQKLADVDEWPLFRWAVIEEFHCIYKDFEKFKISYSDECIRQSEIDS